VKPRITPADVKRVCAHAGITRHQFAASIPRRPNGPTWPMTGNEVSRILNGTSGYGLHVSEAYVGAITAALERLQLRSTSRPSAPSPVPTKNGRLLRRAPRPDARNRYAP
jgi:hypothetical protein